VSAAKQVRDVMFSEWVVIDKSTFIFGA